jgi:diguanylate cyclase (GGDEF)-like protein
VLIPEFHNEKRCISWFRAIALLSAALIPGMSAGSEQLPTLTHAHDIQILSAEQAKREYPVKLRGVVTYVDKIAENLADMFVQDDTAGIFVFLKSSSSFLPLHAGQIVQVDGVSTPGDFSPCVTRAAITILGEGTLPKPKHFPFDELLGAREDGQWTEQEGVVRSGQLKAGRLFLNVAAVGGTFLAIMPDYPVDWATTLIDAKVAMTGALAAIFNDRRQSVGFRLFIPSPAFVRIEEPALANPFELPQVSTLTVAQFRPQGHLDRRIRVRAVVTAVEPGSAVYISDGQGSLEVQSSPFCKAERGDLLDVVGFPGSVDSRPGLQDSICRRVRGSLAEDAVTVTADEVLPAQIDSDPSGYGLSAGKKYDARLIRIEGALQQISQGPGSYTMVLAQGNRTFTATLPGKFSLPPLETGSRLLLTGVCLVIYDQYRRGQFFRVLLRSPFDVVIREHPPWLNLNHALWGLGIAIVFSISALIWVLVLRTKVAQRTAQLHEVSLQDGLTGAANRRQFDNRLRAEFDHAQRAGTNLSLLMIDIDYFKALNDSAGHQRGDACLVEVVHALKSVIPQSTDLVARYGGEEFAIILPGMEHETACRLGEAIRSRVEGLAIPHPGHPQNGVLSVSVGIASLRTGRDGSNAVLIERADRAMYEAKSRGRNRAVSIEEAEQVMAIVA